MNLLSVILHPMGLFPDGLHSAAVAAPLRYGLLVAVTFTVGWLLQWRRLRQGRIDANGAASGETQDETSDKPSPLSSLTAAAAPMTVNPPARGHFVAMPFPAPKALAPLPAAGRCPLDMALQPLRLTLTLQQAVLRYRLRFRNRGVDTLGPLIIRAELVGAGSGMPQYRQLKCEADRPPLCHYLDGLCPGESAEFTGELRLPLADLAAMRLGSAELLVPVMRLCAESAGDAKPGLSSSACFALGISPASSGAGIMPFDLDSKPGIWQKLVARRLNGQDRS